MMEIMVVEVSEMRLRFGRMGIQSSLGSTTFPRAWDFTAVPTLIKRQAVRSVQTADFRTYAFQALAPTLSSSTSQKPKNFRIVDI